MNKARSPLLTLIVLSPLLLSISGCGSSSGILAKRIKEAIGDDVKEYQALTYPTNDFGVGTSYKSNETKSTKISDTNFVCSTWPCVGVEQSSARPKGQDELLRVKVGGVEYAQIGTGGEIKMTSEESTKYGVGVLLPKIEGILNLGVKLDASSVTKVEVTLGRATKRLLSKPDFGAYLRKSTTLPIQKRLRELYSQGGLTVVVGDVIISSIEARITTSSELAPKIDAKISTFPNQIISDANASFEVRKTSATTYTVKTTEPVIALRLLKAQPGAEELSGTGGWEKWMSVDVTDPTVTADGRPQHN